MRRAACSVLYIRQATVIGPTPPGTGVRWPATCLRFGEGDVAHQLRLAVGRRDAVDADVDHRRARLDPVAAHELGLADRHHQDVGGAAEGRQVARARMARWSRCNRRAAAVARPGGRPGSSGRRRRRSCRRAMPSVSASSIEQPSGVQGTGKVERRARRDRAQPADIDRMEAVDVLAGSTASSTCEVSMCLGSGSCTRMPCTDGIGVEPGDQRQQLGLGGVGRQAMIEVRHAELGRDAALALHIDLAGGIVADQHRGEAGLHALGRDQLGDALAHALAQAAATPCRRSASLSHSLTLSQSPPARPRPSRSWHARSGP